MFDNNITDPHAVCVVVLLYVLKYSALAYVCVTLGTTWIPLTLSVALSVPSIHLGYWYGSPSSSVLMSDPYLAIPVYEFASGSGVSTALDHAMS